MTAAPLLHPGLRDGLAEGLRQLAEGGGSASHPRLSPNVAEVVANTLAALRAAGPAGGGRE